MRITPDQRELQDLVRRFFQDSVPPEYLRKRITSGLRRDDALYQALAALGLSEGFASEDGSFSCAELGLVAEEVGRSLFPEPLVERLMADSVVPGMVSDLARTEFGKLGVSSAIAPAACCDLKLNAKSRKVSGSIVWAFGVEGADRLIGSVELGRDGSRVFACSLTHGGVTKRGVTSIDLTLALCSVTLKDVPVVVFSAEESSEISDIYEVLKASEVYGVTSRVLEMSAEYLKSREQFGVPIGAFQAVQQRIADAYAQSESLGALCRFAAWSVRHSPTQRPLTARSAISQGVEVGPLVCEAAIQAHGGIGFTWEYDLHLFLRRAKVIQAAFPSTHDRVEELLARAQAGS